MHRSLPFVLFNHVAISRRRRIINAGQISVLPQADMTSIGANQWIYSPPVYSTIRCYLPVDTGKDRHRVSCSVVPVNQELTRPADH